MRVHDTFGVFAGGLVGRPEASVDAYLSLDLSDVTRSQDS